MAVARVQEDTTRSNRDWGYGIAGCRMKELSRIMNTIAMGYHRRAESAGFEKLTGGKATKDSPGANELWSHILRETREMLASQYENLSDMFEEISKGFADGGAYSREQRDFIKERLSERKIRVRQIIFVPVLDNRREIHMIARVTNGTELLIEEVAYILSLILKETFIPAETSRRMMGREYDYFVFREVEEYRLETGAVRASKSAGEPCGDNYLVMRPCFGEAAMVISDGMGTGKKAYLESAAVIELIELFLQAGFREEAMISLINSVLLLGNEGRAYSTLDLSLINLFDGTILMAKSGASVTYLKHEDYLELVENCALPLGIIPEIKPMVTKKKLFHGESVIMLSDGVLECLPENFLREMKPGAPQDMAGAILLEALRGNRYEPTDDMTVLVATLYRNMENG